MFSAVGTAFGGLAKGVQVKLIAILIGVLVLSNAINWFITSRIYYAKGENQAEVLIKQYEGQVAALQAEVNAKVTTVNEGVTTRVITKTNTVTKTVAGNTRIIYQQVPVSVAQLPKGWIYAHNQAAANLPIDPALAADKTLTAVSDTDALAKVSSNYGICRVNQIQLDEWQKYYTNLQKIYKETTVKDIRDDK